jgi:protein toll
MVTIRSIKDESYFCTDKRDIAIAIVLPIFIVALVILVFVVLILTYRDTISILIYNNPWLRSLLYLYEDNSDKRFDVFVSYSHLDKDFVEDQMVPKLENDPQNDLKFRCLLHVREFVLGRPIIDQISEAVDVSSCTMIVLSTNFVVSQWARHEFDIAYERSKVIVVVKGEMLPKEKMPEGLQKYIQTNTYLSWDDPWFWKKLRYALPHKGANTRCCKFFNVRKKNVHQMHQTTHTIQA